MAKSTASETRQTPARRLECWITRHRVRLWLRVWFLADGRIVRAFDAFDRAEAKAE